MTVVKLIYVEHRAQAQLQTELGSNGKRYLTVCKQAGAYYDKRRGGFVAPRLDLVPGWIDALKAAGFVVHGSKNLLEALRARAREGSEVLAATKARTEAHQTSLQARGLALYPYQEYGSQWLSLRDRALLADAPGLGKTVEVLLALPERAPVIVVCPAVARGVWLREVAKWRPDLTARVVLQLDVWPAPGEVLVINYDRLSPHFHPPQGAPPARLVLIGDEAHLLKNPSTRRVRAWRPLMRAAKVAYGLTATPLLNNPLELWNVLLAFGLSEEVFSGWQTFLRAFQATPKPFGGFDFKTMRPEFVPKLQGVMLRRDKADVLPDLPPKSYVEEDVEIAPMYRRKADVLWREVQAQVLGCPDLDTLLRANPAVFETLTRARRALSVAKIDHLLQRIEVFEEALEPVVVFSSFSDAVDTLAQRPGWAKIDGTVSPQARTDIEERFQRGELKGIAATIRAAGVALTLTRATNAVFLDLDYTPALNLQAEDRIYRIGTTRGVQITRLVADHPMDRHLHKLLTAKQHTITTSIDAATTPASATATNAMQDWLAARHLVPPVP